jgi:hypothetical protein
MMNPTRLLIAVAVMAVLGGLVYYSEENPPSFDDDRVKIIDLEAGDIQEMTILRPGAEPLTLQRNEDEKWEFGAPLKIPADESAVSSLVSSLTPLNSDRVVEENVTDWQAYGLDGAGSLQVDVKAGEDESYSIIFGADTPTGSGVYARLEGDPRLFTLFSYNKTSFEKKVFDLREKKLLSIDGDKISRVIVDAGQRSIEFGKSGDDDWQILKPKPLRADNFAVGDLVRSVQNGEMVSVLEEALEEGGEPSGKYSFAKPFASVEVVDESGAHTLTIAKGQDDKYHAKSSDLPGGVYEVSSTLAEGLDKPLADFRNKKLFDFGFEDPVSVKLRDGETRITVEKKDDKWILTSHEDRELESSKVQSLLDDLRGLRAKEFTSDEEADQEKYGLNQPALEAEVVQADDKGTEKAIMTSLGGEKVYAAIPGQPSTYEIEKSDAESLRSNIEELLKPAEENEDEGEEEQE